MWATQGYLQPFQFVDLAPEDSGNLQADLQNLLDSSGAAIVPADAQVSPQANQ
jgi:hypothetical protein